MSDAAELTIAEAGLPGFDVGLTFGLLAPGKTPKNVVDRLNAEVGKILAMPDVRDTLSKAGGEPVGSTPEEFGAFIRSETQKWGAAVKQAGLKPE